jgi:hypothetical protein
MSKIADIMSKTVSHIRVLENTKSVLYKSIGCHPKEGLPQPGSVSFNGKFIKGFYSKVTSSSSRFAEMWAVRSGIVFARDNGWICNVIFETDFHVLFSMLKTGYTNFTLLLLLLNEIMNPLNLGSFTSPICYSSRETNNVFLC